jgi:hypothetical protein
LVLTAASASEAQVRRYEPSRPTVSPYLNLFRNRDSNPFLPNYYSFVRPLQQQYRLNQTQEQLLQQQGRAIGQLQSQVQQLGQAQMRGPLVAPTGKSSGFMRPGTRSTFLNTSRFYPQPGGAAGGRR